MVLKEIKDLPIDRKKSIPLVRIIGGERSGPPENVKGNWGYHSLLLYLQTYDFSKEILSFIEEYGDRIQKKGYYVGEFQRWSDLNNKLIKHKFLEKINDIYNAVNFYIEVRVPKETWFRSEHFDMAKARKSIRRAFRSTLSAMNAPFMKYVSPKEYFTSRDNEEGITS